MPSLVGLRFHPLPRRPKTLSFFVRLFLMLVNVRVCVQDFAKKALDYRNDFDTVGQGKACSCALVFNFLRLPPTVDITKCRSPQYGKIFLPPEDDRINQSIRIQARKHIPWVCYSTPNLALIVIGKTESVLEAQKCENLPKIVFWPSKADTMNTFR